MTNYTFHYNFIRCLFFLPQPGGNPQVFTVKEKGGILLSFSVDLEGEQKAYMQIPNESSPENLVLMNTQVPEEDSFVVLPDTKLLPPPNV